MPIYEFDCDDCGERFEDLVAVGTQKTECRQCGSAATHRVMSVPSQPWKLVKTPGSARQQEMANAKLHASTKKRFKENRQKQRAARKAHGGGPGS